MEKICDASLFLRHPAPLTAVWISAVRGLFRRGVDLGNGINTIKQGGIQVREDPRLYMHAKIMVIDGQKAFVGSQNISAQSLDQNRELGIIISDQGVLQTLQQTFQQDWGDSQAV